MVTFIHSKKKCRFEAGFLDDCEKIMVIVHIIIYQFLDFEFTSPGRGDELVQFRPVILHLSPFWTIFLKKMTP
jgi:hypothetical protein